MSDSSEGTTSGCGVSVCVGRFIARDTFVNRRFRMGFAIRISILCRSIMFFYLSNKKKIAKIKDYTKYFKNSKIMYTELIWYESQK
tara:strand:- start:143 stop:400 length:258 start_codon:yes stop_codon:yes gene_type:complete